MNNDNYYEIIQKYYKYFFNRIPDEFGFKQYPIFESDLGKEIFEYETEKDLNVNILCLGSNHTTDFFNNY